MKRVTTALVFLLVGGCQAWMPTWRVATPTVAHWRLSSRHRVTTTTPCTAHPETVQPVPSAVVSSTSEAASSESPQMASNDERATKFLNGALLLVTFGWAAWTILSIDSGLTRGWSQSEIAMRIPVDNWSSYEASLEEEPIYTKTMINVVIYLLGDWLSQTVFQGKNVLDFDASRTLKNGFIGLCFGPLVHEYYQFSDHILPVDGPNSMVNRLEKIMMDQTVYLSVKASIYVAAVALLAGDGWKTAKQNVEDKIGGIVVTAWKFWPLVHCLTYSVIPAQHRILWVNCVDLVWNAILASMSRSPSPEEAEEAVAAAELNVAQDDDASVLLVRKQEFITEPMRNDTDVSSSVANSTAAFAPQ